MPERPALLTAGAVFGAGVDAAVPAHYGAPLREQRRYLEGRSVVDLGHAEIVEVRGSDATSWLTTITSQVLTALEVGDSCALTVLSPQGRVEHLASAVLAEPETVWLVLDAGCRQPFMGYLRSMQFAARVEISERDDLRVLASPVSAQQAVPALGAPIAICADHWPQIAPGGVAYGPEPADPVGTVLSIYPAAAVQAHSWGEDELAGMLAYEAIRIADHRVRATHEVDERTIPHELDLLRQAVHTAKGCYRGQETVAKVLNLGQPPRRLVMLHLDGSQDVALHRGGAVRMASAPGRSIGTVTSIGMHADLGPIALAVVRRAVPLDAPLLVDIPAPSATDAATEAPVDAAMDADPPMEAAATVDASQEPVVVERTHGERPPTARL